MREPFHRFRLIVNILLIFEVILGAAIIAVSAVYQHSLGSFMTQRDRKMLSSKFFNFYILGFQLIATYMCSICMWRCVWPRRYSISIRLLVSVWLFFCYIIVICGCTTIWALLDSVDVLNENVAMMMFKGIDVYYTNPEWKFLWDQLQYSRECCGVNGYGDWMHALWMPVVVATTATPTMYRYAEYESDSDEDYAKIEIITDCSAGKEQHYETSTFISESDSRKPTGSTASSGASETFSSESENTLAPYACCRQDSISCYQNYIPKTDDFESICHMNLTEINTRGCLHLFKEYLWCVTNILLILIMAAIIINIFICCLSKYLMFTNGRNLHRAALDIDASFVDDDGNALVVIKCPPKVKCITLEESNAYASSDVADDSEPCICCCDVSDGSTEALLGSQHKRNDLIVH